MKRNEIKSAHENFVLESFVKYSADSGQIIRIIEKPDPPDAIVTINGNKTWIEITDAFFSREIAESVTTYLADDKIHKPVPKDKRKCIDPDQQFSDILESVIVNKYNNESLGKVYHQYGSGILLVGIINPFSNAMELVCTEKQKIMRAIKSKESRFNMIYLYDVHAPVFYNLFQNKE